MCHENLVLNSAIYITGRANKHRYLVKPFWIVFNCVLWNSNHTIPLYRLGLHYVIGSGEWFSILIFIDTFCCFILSFIPYPAPPPCSLQYLFDSAIFYIFEIFYIYLGYFIFIWDILYLFGIFKYIWDILNIFGIFYINLGYFIFIWDCFAT